LILQGNLLISQSSYSWYQQAGVYFFRPVPKEYLHPAELCDIMQFGSSTSAVFFHMRIAGAFRVFQFKTKQGKDMCVALQTHINDVMVKHLARARFISNGPLKNTGLSSNVKPPSVEVYEKRLHEMSKLLESSQKRIDELVKDMMRKYSWIFSGSILIGSLFWLNNWLRQLEVYFGCHG
jgi:hypothetical protein